MNGTKTAKIVLGGGFFWCTEAVFKQLKGIAAVRPGYAGGETSKPTYKEVSTGNTAHAEVVQVEYFPSRVSLEKLLEVFFLAHDPTTLNRQGNDVGSWYRSIILYTTVEQCLKIEQFINDLEESSKYNEPIVTEVKALTKFYPAEDEHQNYWRKHPKQAYCEFVIAPKVEKVKQVLESEEAGRQVLK